MRSNQQNSHRDDLDDLSFLETGIPAEGEFTLEDILAEYGGGRTRHLIDEVDQAVRSLVQPVEPPAPSTPRTASVVSVSAPPTPDPTPPPDPAPTPPPDPVPAPTSAETVHTDSPQAPVYDRRWLQELQSELPSTPKPLTMEQLVGQTVDEVMEEAAERKTRRRGLFSRKPIDDDDDDAEDLDSLYDSDPDPDPEPEPEPSEEESIGEEPDMDEAARSARMLYRWCHRPLKLVVVLALIPAVMLAAETFRIPLPAGEWQTFWTTKTQTGVLALILLALCGLSNGVFIRAWESLRQGRCTGDLLTALSAVVTLADCVSTVLLPERSTVPPYTAAAGMGFVFALWGGSRLGDGGSQTFQLASMSDPPYMLADTPEGACKQRGRLFGFFTCTNRPDVSSWWQAALLPIVLIGTAAFAALASESGQHCRQNFLLNWSAILTAAASYALPLSYALPFDRVARRLQKSGCAVAGYDGAERLCRCRTAILTDVDLFPPGSITLNDILLYGESRRKAVSYAATLVRASNCGLQRLFDDLLRSEGIFREELSNFCFYKEGGFAGQIRGETVLLGTASFMRKMEVRVPGGVKLPTGVYLASDRQLMAIFDIRYHVTDNVDWALRLLQKNHITPILASRDPNITPQFLKKKFSRTAHVKFPKLSDRIALSEQGYQRDLPRALLYREGLLPYADAIVGSLRLVQAVRRSTVFALLGSIIGALLVFYLTFQGEFTLLSPWNLLLYQLLWVVPTILLTDWSGRF